MLDLEKMTAVANAQAEYIKASGVQEIGSSDISGWVFEMMDQLGFDRGDKGMFMLLQQALVNRI